MKQKNKKLNFSVTFLYVFLKIQAMEPNKEKAQRQPGGQLRTGMKWKQMCAWENTGMPTQR